MGLISIGSSLSDDIKEVGNSVGKGGLVVEELIDVKLIGAEGSVGSVGGSGLVGKDSVDAGISSIRGGGRSSGEGKRGIGSSGGADSY